ncbi:hypothetical protein HPC49_45525 [Pyxidicoccus fallax]|uniref:Secreted protein n=1 Tax=Pyxidicoccus fallax TaxID=394095 RepID=A0A848LRV7_9BACT|nr:hypothetical protein [Pyxidicoccus fallax]NMO20677.1 hypothetical protein [Pyxidicoccus fallax]NPC85442.1 hypothetical protein [Pyxidicoccus fallax]
MKLLKTFVAALSLALLLPTAAAEASDYPPDYAICNSSDTKTTGPFEVIRRTTRLPGRQSTLTVAYRGFLRNLYPDNQISIFVKLNGQYATFQASSGTNNDAYIYLNAGQRNCTKCFTYMNTPLCNAHFAAGGQEGVWVCEQPTAQESHLFLYGWDQNGYMNAWDIEVAAVANGQWDSNGGANYFTRLPAHTSCW